MRVAHDARFRGQSDRFRLRFACEHCAQFARATEACAHGFPTADHRLARYESDAVDVVFCKDFELE